MFISACSPRYPVHPPSRQKEGKHQIFLPIAPLSTSHWSARHELVATAEWFWQVWRKWETAAAKCALMPCHGLPSPLPPCSYHLNWRVHWSRMLTLACRSSVMRRPQAPRAALLMPNLRGSCWISSFFIHFQCTHRYFGNVSQDGDSLRSYPVMLQYTLCHHMPLLWQIGCYMLCALGRAGALSMCDCHLSKKV